MQVYKLSDRSIAQIVRLIQLGILTGTDVTDQLRTFELCVGSENKMEPSPDFLESFEENLKSMSQKNQEE